MMSCRAPFVCWLVREGFGTMHTIYNFTFFCLPHSLLYPLPRQRTSSLALLSGHSRHPCRIANHSASIRSGRDGRAVGISSKSGYLGRDRDQVQGGSRPGQEGFYWFIVTSCPFFCAIAFLRVSVRPVNIVTLARDACEIPRL